MRYLGILLLLCLSAVNAQELRVTVERSEPAAFKVEVVKPPVAASADLSRFAVKLSVARKILASGVNTSAGIVTCEHVVRGYSEFTAECDGETAAAKVMWFDGKHDVALLSVKWTKQHDVSSVGTSPLGEVLRLVGRGDNGLIRETSHKFLAVNEHSELTFTDPRNSGASGSGLFNESGELVAIFNGAIVDTEPYIGRAITIDKVPQLRSKAVSSSSQIECTVHTADGLWCLPCNTFKTNNGNGNERIKFTYTTAKPPVPIDQIPCTTFLDKDGGLRYIIGYKPTADILAIVEKYR